MDIRGTFLNGIFLFKDMLDSQVFSQRPIGSKYLCQAFPLVLLISLLCPPHILGFLLPPNCCRCFLPSPLLNLLLDLLSSFWKALKDGLKGLLEASSDHSSSREFSSSEWGRTTHSSFKLLPSLLPKKLGNRREAKIIFSLYSFILNKYLNLEFYTVCMYYLFNKINF